MFGTGGSRVVWPWKQSLECISTNQGLLAATGAGRGRNGFSPIVSGGKVVLPVPMKLTSDFWPPELQKNKLLLFKP